MTDDDKKAIIQGRYDQLQAERFQRGIDYQINAANPLCTLDSLAGIMAQLRAFDAAITMLEHQYGCREDGPPTRATPADPSKVPSPAGA